MSMPALPTIDHARRFQSFQIVELLIDLIYGDIVTGDSCCRRVADALIAQYEDAIRWLATEEPSVPSALQGAINAYCARHVLYAAPELLLVSRDASNAYAQIADVLRGADELSGIGAAMSEELSRLARRLETRAFSRLLDLLGEAVVAYMARAAREHSSAAGTAPAFMDCAVRFAAAAAARSGRTPSGSRSGVKRERADESHAREEEGEEQGEHGEQGEQGVQRNLSLGTSTGSELTPRQQFPRDLRLAMTSPSPKQREPMPQRRNRPEQQQQQQQQQQQLNRNPVVRVVRQTDDSILSTVENLRPGVVRDVSSILVADDSTHENPPPPPPLRSGPRIAGGEDLRGAADTSLLGTSVHVRRYFLCHKTGRYEPMVVKGFYA